jgi:dihydroflavonol-4-reductase
MRTLVTGSTGLIGNAVTKRLVRDGHSVRALVRDPDRARPLVPASVELARGDIEDAASLVGPLDGIEWVFHTAGMPEQWQRDETAFDRVNTKGTANVATKSLEAGVKRLVYTSTMDVFAAPPGGTLVETHIDPSPKPTAYERSKQAAEREAEGVRARGLDLVYLNPGAVYGPSPVHVGVNSLFIQLLRGQMPMVPPGGMSLAFVEGVAGAHLAAAERGQSGERYLIADTHASNHEFVALIAREAGLTKVPNVAPRWLMQAVAHGSAPLARAFGFRPLIAPGQLSFLLWNPRIDTSKAERELGFTATPLDVGVRQTVEFLRSESLVPKRA